MQVQKLIYRVMYLTLHDVSYAYDNDQPVHAQ